MTRPTNPDAFTEAMARAEDRKAAEDSLPEPVQELLTGMRAYLLQGSRPDTATYQFLKGLCVSIWGAK